MCACAFFEARHFSCFFFLILKGNQTGRPNHVGQNQESEHSLRAQAEVAHHLSGEALKVGRCFGI